MDRASVFGTEGWEFESLRARHESNRLDVCPLIRSCQVAVGFADFASQLPSTPFLAIFNNLAYDASRGRAGEYRQT